jgi:hypothetical protein
MSLLPVGIRLLDWAQELRCEYPDDDIPALYDEKGWKDWGNSLRLIGIFSGSSIPRTESFSDWREWAQRLTQVIGA